MVSRIVDGVQFTEQWAIAFHFARDSDSKCIFEE